LELLGLTLDLGKITNYEITNYEWGVFCFEASGFYNGFGENYELGGVIAVGLGWSVLASAHKLLNELHCDEIWTSIKDCSYVLRVN